MEGDRSEMNTASATNVAAGVWADVLKPRGARYPGLYVWFVFAAALDVVFTRIVLWFGGMEVNGVAQRMLDAFGLAGLVMLKFSSVVLVVLICEAVGRRREGTGRKLAGWAVGLSFVPVAVAAVQLVGVSLTGGLGLGMHGPDAGVLGLGARE